MPMEQVTPEFQSVVFFSGCKEYTTHEDQVPEGMVAKEVPEVVGYPDEINRLSVYVAVATQLL